MFPPKPASAAFNSASLVELAVDSCRPRKLTTNIHEPSQRLLRSLIHHTKRCSHLKPVSHVRQIVVRHACDSVMTETRQSGDFSGAKQTSGATHRLTAVSL